MVRNTWCTAPNHFGGVKVEHMGPTPLPKRPTGLPLQLLASVHESVRVFEIVELVSNSKVCLLKYAQKILQKTRKARSTTGKNTTRFDCVWGVLKTPQNTRKSINLAMSCARRYGLFSGKYFLLNSRATPRGHPALRFQQFPCQTAPYPCAQLTAWLIDALG